MYIFVGNSASGKTFISDGLVKYYGFKKVVTWTTRKMRPGEVNGIDYNFVTSEKFDELVKDNFFYEHSEYAGNQYGSHFSEEDIKSSKTYIILDIDGALKLRNSFGMNVTIVAIYTPLEIIKKRLEQRGSDEEDIQKRLSNIYSLDDLFEVADIMLPGTINIDEAAGKLIEGGC